MFPSSAFLPSTLLLPFLPSFSLSCLYFFLYLSFTIFHFRPSFPSLLSYFLLVIRHFSLLSPRPSIISYQSFLPAILYLSLSFNSSLPPCLPTFTSVILLFSLFALVYVLHSFLPPFVQFLCCYLFCLSFPSIVQEHPE